jgi:hypothetical protein
MEDVIHMSPDLFESRQTLSSSRMLKVDKVK